LTSQTPMVYGLIGNPVSHSLSPIMQNTAFKKTGHPHKYHLFKVSENEVEKAVLGADALGFGGLNVTIPHKEAAYRVCDTHDGDAMAAEAVNTIKFNDEIKGYNTDITGARRAVEQKIEPPIKAVIVGAGGAARGVCIALKDTSNEIVILNRTVSKANKLKKQIENKGCSVTSGGLDQLERELVDADLLVNATPLGMEPDTNKTIATEKTLHQELTVFDLVYRPRDTRLLREASSVGAETIDGVEMLVQQGAASFKIWTGIEPPTDSMREVVVKELEK